MRIAFFANADNIHTKRWAEFLRSRGHDLRIFCDPPVHNPPPGIPLIHPEMNLLTQVLAFRLFPKPYGNNYFKRFPYKHAVKAFAPDIVHGFEALGYGYALAHCGPYPKVLTPWGNDILCDPRESRIARFLVQKALDSADMITTNFLELAEYLTKDFSIPESKIRPFSWGVDLSIFHPGYREEAAFLKRDLHLPSDSRILLSSRMMKPYWGIETIARALPRVFREIPNSYAVFLRGAGEETFENHIREIIQKSGFLDRVRFVPEYLTEKQMAVYLNMAEAFVSCPKSDLLSLSVLEGMACGCAPILGLLPAYKKRVVHKHNGLFFKPENTENLADTVIGFLRNHTLKNEFAEINIKLIREKDDWNKNAPQLEEIYLNLAEQKKKQKGRLR